LSNKFSKPNIASSYCQRAAAVACVTGSNSAWPDMYGNRGGWLTVAVTVANWMATQTAVA